jgi:hypothetical protein
MLRTGYERNATMVHCDGETRLIELSGERHDFQAEVTLAGFHHEQFSLHVRRDPPAAGERWNPHWDPRYWVTVDGLGEGCRRVYRGGPGEQWVARFAADLRRGLFGSPVPLRELATSDR